MPTPSKAALEHVRSIARRTGVDVDVALLEDVRRRAALTINFHPDRPSRDGRTAAAALADDGMYRTQFETGISAGGLDAVMNGARSRWERAMFGSAYDGVVAADRPRYGGLDLVGYAAGACPRFGSCHLRLRPHLRECATYSYGDSVTEPTAVGTWDTLGPVVAAAVVDDMPEVHARHAGFARLDRYVEAQIHHRVDLRTDVEALVADPSFRGSPVGDDLQRMATRFAVPLRWHDGYVLDAEGLDPQFRTELSPRLAKDVHTRLARPGQQLDAELIGRAVQAVVADPAAWAAYGDVVQVLQELKHLWHHLVDRGAVDQERS
ncbi:DUF3626 domain-containing protein [Luteipulveratus halotolerans]|uniref:DUF3626 domain-containing protein n=1 Tax=Luteipulveratus halotolerans TaxID=1631356 RepID=A0A0L6CG43_9MICO|nr:DUF3626 domain-containing protein [Luteipulveratus halotolerans]KNX36772.1 hypothetical protein VV01_05810 [Luteipulveratus halotolerans]